MFKCFKNQSDTYHDTQTHYLMEKDLLLLHDQVGGMDTVASDKWTALKKRGALRGHAQFIWLLVLHV